MPDSRSHAQDLVRKRYPIWRWGFLGWILPGLTAIVLAVLIGINASQNTDTGIAISLVTTSTLAIICFAGCGIQLWQRCTVLRKVVWFQAPIAIRFDRIPLSQAAEHWMRMLLCPPTAVTDSIRNSLLKQGIVVSRGAWQPITFVTFCRPGTIKRVWHNIVQRCRGITRSQWCEIEWEWGSLNPILGESRTLSLTYHELAHVALSATYKTLSTTEQHNIMRSAGIK